MTLLEKAKQIKTKHAKIGDISQEHMELALGWLKGEVIFTQISQVLFGKSGGTSVYIMLARALKKAHQKGLLKIVN